jgi:hypothetical protein
MFADPHILYVVPPTNGTTTNAVTGAGYSSFSFVCTGRGPLSSTYRYTISTSHWIDLFIGRQEGKVTRSTVRLVERELVTDPMDSSINSVKVSSCYVVVSLGPLGAGTNLLKMLHGLAVMMYDSQDDTQQIARVLAGET